MNQPDLFAWPAAEGKTDTSREAAKKCKPTYWRGRVVQAFREHDGDGLTADECAEILGASVLTIRPRFTELYQRGYIERTEQRRRNRNGSTVAVYRLNPLKHFLS